MNFKIKKVVQYFTALLFALVTAFILGAAATLLFSAHTSEIVAIAVFVSAAAFAVMSMPKQAILPMYLATMTTGAGIVTTIDIQFVPQAILITGAATQLTGLKVEVLGQNLPIVDLDANGITAIGQHRRLGLTANTYIIPVADGIITDKTVRITLTNSAAQTPAVYAFGTQKGTGFVCSSKQPLLANSNTTFDNFAALFCPALAATTDLATITYQDGLSQIWERSDMQQYSGLFQNTPSYLIDNLDGSVKRVNLNVAAAQTVYKMTFMKA